MREHVNVRLRHMPRDSEHEGRRGVWRAMDLADAFGVDVSAVQRYGQVVAYDRHGAPYWSGFTATRPDLLQR